MSPLLSVWHWCLTGAVSWNPYMSLLEWPGLPHNMVVRIQGQGKGIVFRSSGCWNKVPQICPLIALAGRGLKWVLPGKHQGVGGMFFFRSFRVESVSWPFSASNTVFLGLEDLLHLQSWQRHCLLHVGTSSAHQYSCDCILGPEIQADLPISGPLTSASFATYGGIHSLNSGCQRLRG